MSSLTNKPWRGKDGKILEDKVIKKISKSWNQEDWDSYFYDIKIDKPMHSMESIHSTYSFLLETHDNTSIEESDQPTKLDLSSHTNKLKKDSRILLHLTYWEDMPLTGVSEALSRNYYQTKKLKDQTLEALKDSVSKDLKIMEAYHGKA